MKISNKIAELPPPPSFVVPVQVRNNCNIFLHFPFHCLTTSHVCSWCSDQLFCFSCRLPGLDYQLIWWRLQHSFHFVARWYHIQSPHCHAVHWANCEGSSNLALLCKDAFPKLQGRNIDTWSQQANQRPKEAATLRKRTSKGDHRELHAGIFGQRTTIEVVACVALC